MIGRKTFLSIVTLLLCLGGMSGSVANAQAAPSPPKPDDLIYTLEDFSSFLPSLYVGRPDISGSAPAETRIVHSGKRAVRLNWDFTGAASPDNAFALLQFHRVLVGHAEAVSAWVYAEPPEKGAVLRLWIQDYSGEDYLSDARVDWVGWKKVVIPIATAPAWDSGDRNRVADPPLSLALFGVPIGGPKKGSLVIADIEVITRATPTEAQIASVETDQPFNTFWGQRAQINFGSRNVANVPVSGLHYAVQVTEEYSGRTVWTGDIPLPTIQPRSAVKAVTALDVPFGVQDIHWTLMDNGDTLQKGQFTFTRMSPACSQNLPPAEDAYLRLTCPWGGVFYQSVPSVASKAGARWIRDETAWRDLEPKPGVYHFELYSKTMAAYQSYGIESLNFETLYNQPAFRHNDQPSFAPSYGRLMQGLAARTPSEKWYELGNEENGPTKMIYTEEARSGAAGIHSANPAALVGNAATAFVDMSWLRMQGGRGLYDWLDTLCVHPYTIGSGPEAWNVYGQAQNVVQYGDELGGMKHYWTTEFGWDFNGVTQKDRADWTPRHFLVGVAGGYEKTGLYSWDGAFGIFQNGYPYPPGVSVHAMAHFLEGSRYAGLLQHDDQAWATVWEKFGKPVLVAWVPSGTKDWNIAVGSAPVKVYDLFGNPLPAEIANGILTLYLTPGPQYVLGAYPSLTQKAWASQMQALQYRYALHLAKTSLKNASALAPIAHAADLSPAMLFAALKAAGRQPNAPKADISGVQANLLRMLMLQARMGRLALTTPASLEEAAAFPSAAQAALHQAQKQDLDLPRLRWALTEYQTLEAERKFAQEEGASAFVRRLLSAEAVLAAFADHALMTKGEQVFTAAWPYLYTTTDTHALRERLVFTPGTPTKVNVRIDNYARHDYPAKVSLQLPHGWTCQPTARMVSLHANQPAETSFHVTCASDSAGEAPKIIASLSVSGKPVRQVSFDDMEIAPAISVIAEPVAGQLLSTPVHLRLTNRDNKPVSGHVRLLLKGQSTALARADFSAITPGQTQVLSVHLSGAQPRNEWPLTAELDFSDGRKSTQNFNLDFAAAVQTSQPVTLNGDLSGWGDALPLHIDRSEYALASYGSSWTPEDESANTWVKWDSQYLYFAAVVHDQTFNQTQHGAAIWTQDSIQIGLAPGDTGPYTELALAKTPQGEEVYRFTGPEGDVVGAKLKVTLSQGQAVYEAAIPWSAIAGAGPPAVGQTFRYDVLLNDDDAVIPRRYMERYGLGIVNTKNVKDFGFLHLIGPGVAPVSTGANPNVIFGEDFEEYADGSQPDAWQRLTQNPPVPEGAVRGGAGRNGSKALVLKNEAGLLPFVYLVYVRPIDNLEADTSYVLHFWERGKGVADTGATVGLCSDQLGIQGQIYTGGWKVTDQWQEVVMPFTAPASTFNLIIRNASAIGELDIDDISIEKAPKNK